MRFAIFISLLLTSACGTTPMDPDAFRTDTKNDSEMKVVPLPQVTFAKAKKRLVAFAEKCLNTPVKPTDTTVYTPRLFAKKDTLTLTYQGKPTGNQSAGGMPKDGFYSLVIDVFKTGSGTRVESYFYNRTGRHWENYHGRAMSWLTNEKRVCPDAG